jgi:hypothetical protein
MYNTGTEDIAIANCEDRVDITVVDYDLVDEGMLQERIVSYERK